MIQKLNGGGRVMRTIVCIVFAIGIALLPGCKTVNKVNPISDESYCHWLFALPHKAVKTVLDIDEE
jgi:hypothetical protein